MEEIGDERKKFLIKICVVVRQGRVMRGVVAKQWYRRRVMCTIVRTL